MIIVVGGIKGGSGKTTIATNIAIMRSYEKPNILLVDADDQETSYDFFIFAQPTPYAALTFLIIKPSPPFLIIELK